MESTIKEGDKFLIQLSDGNKFVGYVQYNVVKDVLGHEYVLVRGSLNNDEAVVFTYNFIYINSFMLRSRSFQQGRICCDFRYYEFNYSYFLTNFMYEKYVYIFSN